MAQPDTPYEDPIETEHHLDIPFGIKINLKNFIFYFATLAGLIIIYLKFSEIQSIRDIFERSDIFWLTAIILAQISTYVSLAMSYHQVLKIKGLTLSLGDLLPMTLIVQFLNQILPSATISGQIFFISHLRRHGMTVTEGISRAVLEIASLYSAFGILFIIAIILMLSQGILTRHPDIRFLIILFIALAILFILIFLFLQSKRGHKLFQWINRYSRKQATRSRNGSMPARSSYLPLVIQEFKYTLNIRSLQKNNQGWRFLWATLWQMAIYMADVVSLYFIFFAIDSHISFTTAFIVFILTSFVSMIAFIPGGIGVFEGSMTLMLVSFGVPGKIAFAATLLLRAVTFWLPMPIGWYLYRRYTRREAVSSGQ